MKNYVINTIKKQGIATITNMCIKEEYRNKHIGYKLLNTVIMEYEKNNNNDVKYIQFCVLAHNLSAIKLYQNLGLKQISGIEKGFNGYRMRKPDVVVMQLQVK